MTVWAVVKDVDGISGEESLVSWAGEPFKTYENASEALAECLRINKIYRDNGIREVAYIVSGVLEFNEFIPD